MKNRLTITVDGYSSCGKSTFAKAIAAELGYLYLDSGSMYRAVTLFCLRKQLVKDGIADKAAIIRSLGSINISFRHDRATGHHEVLLNNESVEREIRDREVSDNVSAVSTIAEVREKMVILQRQIGRDGGIVMDGRDIGTVVFPDAAIKIFMTASPEIRAQRRYLELKEKGMKADIEAVERNIRERDHIDESRDVSPLRKADDAILLDNSHMTPGEQMEWFRNIYNRKINEG